MSSDLGQQLRLIISPNFMSIKSKNKCKKNHMLVIINTYHGDYDHFIDNNIIISERVGSKLPILKYLSTASPLFSTSN